MPENPAGSDTDKDMGFPVFCMIGNGIKLFLMTFPAPVFAVHKRGSFLAKTVCALRRGSLPCGAVRARQMRGIQGASARKERGIK